MDAMIYVGASKKTIEAMDKTIMHIIESVNSESVKIQALVSLKEGVSVTGTNIQYCTLYGDKKDEKQQDRNESDNAH
jgi:alpha-tubulin suppressor-like RCC1 family protein